MTPRTSCLLVVVICLSQSGCRCRSDLGSDHATLAGAAEMARSFWLEVLAGNYDAAEAYLASDEEIGAALEGWARVMNEPIDEAALEREVDGTRKRLDASWEKIRDGQDPNPGGIDAEGVKRADTIVGNKMYLGPGVSYIQRLSLTGPGVEPEQARVAGAVRVGDGDWKILWLP